MFLIFVRFSESRRHYFARYLMVFVCVFDFLRFEGTFLLGYSCYTYFIKIFDFLWLEDIFHFFDFLMVNGLQVKGGGV